MKGEHPDNLLATVQELREHLQSYPDASAVFESIRRYWLSSQLFPPDDELLHKALNVLLNAGDLTIEQSRGAVLFSARNPRGTVLDE